MGFKYAVAEKQPGTSLVTGKSRLSGEESYHVRLHFDEGGVAEYFDRSDGVKLVAAKLRVMADRLESVSKTDGWKSR